MGGGPKYSRMKGIGRPKVSEYVDRVVVFSNKKIDKESTECPKCKFKAMYKFVRCPQCNEMQKT